METKPLNISLTMEMQNAENVTKGSKTKLQDNKQILIDIATL
jgi:hypothetical protein